MTETSKARFTITLGQSGRVVERAETVQDDDYTASFRGGGSKRSVRDRLGSNFDSSTSRGNNKRQRGESSLTGSNSNGFEDVRLGKDDLRLKLMRKTASRRAKSDDEEKTMDLREKLSRTAHPPNQVLSNFQARQGIPQARNSSILGPIPPIKNADDLYRMNSSRHSYSPWTLDHIRRRSPDRTIGTSGVFSPPRNVEEMPRRPVNRAFDDLRPVSYMSRDAVDASRPVSSTTAFMKKSTLPSPSTKSAVSLIGQHPPSSGIVQKSAYTVEEPQTVEGLLHSLGLGKYVILFKAEEVDMPALKQMRENDLKELGIPMGPRKKILQALLPYSKRQV